MSRINLSESEIEIFAKAIELSKERGLNFYVVNQNDQQTRVKIKHKDEDEGGYFEVHSKDKLFLDNTKKYIKTVLS